MFIDYAKIYLKSGKGGDGHISFRRELYVANGGPNGGDGGSGGDVILRVDNSINTLFSFKNKFKYIAENGENGNKNKCHGRNGKDLIIDVPNGTIVRDTNTNKIIVDMTGNNKIFTILKGGKGGIGNMHFATSRMQAPRYAKPGGSSEEIFVTLELKVLADVSLVGFPNVGKSSFISKVSNAKPEIANYPFTTLNPHLGVVKYANTEFVIADIPGIIEGAANGVGLGIQFLKHIERSKIILHIIDVSEYSGRNPINDLDIILNEIKKYNKELLNKKQIVILNKIDTITDDRLKKIIDEISKRHLNLNIITISILKNININLVLNSIVNALKEIKDTNIIFEPEIYLNLKKDVENVEFIITNNIYEISGEKIKKVLGYTNLDTEKGILFLHNFLQKEGIINELKQKGLIDGSIIKIYGYEFEYRD